MVDHRLGTALLTAARVLRSHVLRTPQLKIFWSWQSDTPGEIGRHFVRDAIKDAIIVLKQPQDIEEPSEREARESLDIDHDRKGVSGSPDLARTILEKIAKAAVFIGDVTLVGESPLTGKDGAKKKLINSNVAIEYGFALHALTDSRVLLVQNTYFGHRDELPFDLRHKAGPIQFNLAPRSSRNAIADAKGRLKNDLVLALRGCLMHASSAVAPPFQETQPTSNRAFFWQPGEVLATSERSAYSEFRGDPDDTIRYTLSEPHVLYVRLIPIASLPQELTTRALSKAAKAKGSATLISRTHNKASASRNAHGVAVYQPFGSDTTLLALTQLFQNGEVWSVSREMIYSVYQQAALPIMNLRNSLSNSLHGIADLAPDLDLSPPFKIELGAVGLKGLRISGPLNKPTYATSGEIFRDVVHDTKIVDNLTDSTIAEIVQGFLHKLCDHADFDERLIPSS